MKRLHPLSFTIVVSIALICVVLSIGVFFALGELRLRTLEANVEQLHTETLRATSTAMFPPVISIPSTDAQPTPILSTDFTQQLSPVARVVEHEAADTATQDPAVLNDRIVGNAVSVTSDGWLISVDPVFSQNGAENFEIAWAGRTYPIQKIIRDHFTHAIFLKIAAQHLPSASLLPSDMAIAGMSAWIEPVAQRFLPTTVVDTRPESFNTRFSSDEADRRFLLPERVSQNEFGAPVWNRDGALIGLVESFDGSYASVLPAGNMSAGLQQILNTGSIHHASLGVNGFDLSNVIRETGATVLPRQGFWLHANQRTSVLSIEKTSPATHLLQEGDVLQNLDNDVLDGRVDLGSHLLEFQPGAMVSLQVVRAGKVLTIPLQLGNQLTSQVLK